MGVGAWMPMEGRRVWREMWKKERERGGRGRRVRERVLARRRRRREMLRFAFGRNAFSFPLSPTLTLFHTPSYAYRNSIVEVKLFERLWELFFGRADKVDAFAAARCFRCRRRRRSRQRFVGRCRCRDGHMMPRKSTQMVSRRRLQPRGMEIKSKKGGARERWGGHSSRARRCCRRRRRRRCRRLRLRQRRSSQRERPHGFCDSSL